MLDRMTATAYPLSDRPGWKDNLPFWSVHALAIGGAISVGWGWSAFDVAVAAVKIWLHDSLYACY